MPDVDKTPSFGYLFERLEQVENTAEEVMGNSTEFYEKRIADALMDLHSTVEDIVIILRDHLACHDCPDPEEEPDDG